MIRKCMSVVIETLGWIVTMVILATALLIAYSCKSIVWLYKGVGRVVGYRGSKKRRM